PRPPARPRAAITWEQLAARNQFGGLERQALARVGPTVGGAAGPSYQPVGGGGGGGAFQCPPQALSVLCELHPDTVAFPDVAIIRFTSLTQAQVDDVLAQVGLSPAQLQTLTPGAVADAIAGGIRDQIDLLFPPAVAMQLGSLYGDALDAIETATGDVLFAAASAALGGGASVYDAIVAAAYAGIPCPTVILKLSGTFSHASVSTVLSLTGAVTVNVGSGAGLGGTVNLVGIPVGDATAFFSLTDAVGDVNPSLCGEVEAALGPIELGRLEALYECQGCSNALFEAAEQFAGCVTAPGADALLLDAVAEVAPDLDLAGLAPPDAVAQLTPEQATAFLGQMFAVPAASLAFDEACFADVVDSLYAAVDPRISLDGAVAPRIFGIPVGESLVAVQMRLDKTALTAGLGFSPSFLIGNVGLCLGTIGVFCSPVFPALDAGTLTATLPLPNAADVLSAGLRGDLASPAAIDAFLADGTNDLLERGLFLLDYRFAPFGLEMAGAEARVVMPNLLEHPGAPASSWVPPELRGDPDLPGRRELLIAALENQVGFENGFLANLDWLGQREDLYLVYPDGSPERDALLDCHPGEAEPGCSVREDYFPYGGLLGAAQLALPAILTETPSPTLFEALDPAGDPFARALAAVDVITNQVLVTGAPLGSLAFYVPGPTPPAFCDEPSPALDPVGLVESLRGFDFDTVLQEVQQQGLLPACEQADAIFPVEEAFFEGYVESRLFGVEFARADLTVSAPDQLLRAEGGTNDVPCIEDDPVDGDWLGCFVDSASLTFEIRAGGDPSCVPGPVETCAPPDFYALLPGLVADLGAGDPGAALAEFETTLIEGLPKVALHASLQGFRLPAPLDQYATASGSVALGAFSPRFDPDFSDDLPDGSPIGDARRHGGIGLEIEDLAFGVPELGIDPFTIDSAQLALTFGAGGGLPGFAGLFSASSIALSPGVTLESVSIQFDSEPGSQGTILGAGGVVTPFVLSTSGSSACGADDVCLTVSGIGGAPLGGALTVRAGVDPGTDPPSSELLLDPAQLDLALLGAGLSGRIHGAGGIDEPFTFDTAGPWNAGFSLTTDLVVTDPFNGDAPVVRIESLSGDPVLTGTIAVTGTGFPAITANATADVRITLYPGQPQEASFPASAGEAQLVLQPDGSYSLALAAPALGQPGVFALAGGALTVSGSPSGVAVSLVGPQLTLFEGAPYQGTLTAGQCDLAADRFACSTEGSALTLPGLGAFDFAGDVALTPTSASGSIRSTGIAIPDDANVVALEPPVGRRDFGAAFTAGAGSLELTIAAPAVSLFGSPLPGAIPGVARIAFASDGSFALDFATARDFALLPDLVEFGAGAFSLTYSGGADPRIGFGFRSGLRLVALPPEADTDHLVDLPAFTLTGSCLLSSLAGGFQCPLDGTVDFAPPFDPVVGLGSFLQVVPSSATEIDFGRDVRGGVYVDARDLGVTLLGRDLGEFDASANTATGVFRLTASPPNLTLGAFVLDPIGSISIDLDFANGTAGASFPATRVRAPGVPQLPSGGVLFGGFALDPDGSFTTSASASLSWDGLSLGSAALTLTRRAGGVIGLEIAGATPPFDLGLVSVIPRSGSTIPLRVSVSSSGSASLSMGPARADLDAFGLETAVELYGASSSQPFSFSTTGPWSATIRSLGSVRFDPLGTGEVLRISPASAPLFQGSFSGNGLGAPSFSFSTTGSSTVTLFDGSAMDRVFTKGSGGVALSLTTGGRFRVSMSLPTIEYDNVFRLSSSSLLYEVDSGGFDFTVSSPTLTLFDDTSYLNTIVLPSCALSRSSFSCTSNGNSLSFPQIGSFSFSGSITLGASGFAFAASTGGLSFPSNGSLLAVGPGSASLSYTSSRVLSLSVTNPTATVLGQSFASNLVSGVSFTMQSNGSFTATLSTSSTRTLFGSSVLRMRSGGVTLTRSSSGALNLSASGELRIDHPNSSFNIVTTTRTFDLSIGTGTSSHTLASGLPSFDLGWFQVTPGNVVVTRSSSGVWSLAANDWDFELLGDSFPNVDFSIASNGSVDVDLGNRVFDIGGIRLDVNAGIPLDWDIDTGALSVPIPTQTNLIVTGISGLSGTLANGLDLIGFTIGTNGSFDMPALNRSLTLDGANFGSMAVDLRRSSATGSIIFEMTGDVNNSFFDADLDLEARSSGFFSFSLTGSAGFTQVCDCGFLQRCDPLCPFTGFDETPTLGGLDVDYLPTSSTPFQGTASLLGASFDVDFTGTTLSFCTAGICLDFTSPF
ncbi:MAG: hypothetical protein QNK03_05015, partial [Myxococcota bacterium]|nr:hypothetical protein [Myxococcota bacterium]